MKFPFTPLFLRRTAKFGTKVSVDLEENVAKALETVEFKPRKHPGVIKVKTVKMPEFLERTIPKVTQDFPIASIRNDAQALNKYLWSRHPPPTAAEIKAKQEKFRDLLIAKHKFNFAEMTETERHKANNTLFSKVQTRLRQEIYSWKSIQYDTYKSLQYLLGRSPAEYAAMVKILTEIRDRDANFCPRSYFDFGSGVGSALWATIDVWPKKNIFEYFMVDTSADMNDLAELILRQGNPDREPMVRNYFFRQFLPASATNTYDLVICAYTLFELASKDARLMALKTLWTKCEHYMVIVERGTKAGFTLITEARDFLLRIDPDNCHVHSPCPHEFVCPRRVADDGTPCNFEVKYENLAAMEKNRIQNETYSYVVLRKKPRDLSQTEDSWPRIVRPVLVRKKHAICRMCTKEGNLQEIIFTAAKQGKMTYYCAKKSNWGDRLPINIVNPEPEAAESQEDSSQRPEEEVRDKE
ncbi:methyltransferase-like protein 17, mitochondrial [Phlebotomus argentipes]|uniref:methyltransferase-like protein 17, mitochondrial n=1 Tax=Phlebotomus argentipes TaxID=94469 RepID=UPI0028931ABB|nr:methyltransferase-like protein 17, mitochondrial [Phlebotomus argentipes]